MLFMIDQILTLTVEMRSRLLYTIFGLEIPLSMRVWIKVPQICDVNKAISEFCHNYASRAVIVTQKGYSKLCSLTMIQSVQAAVQVR